MGGVDARMCALAPGTPHSEWGVRLADVAFLDFGPWWGGFTVADDILVVGQTRQNLQ